MPLVLRAAHGDVGHAFEKGCALCNQRSIAYMCYSDRRQSTTTTTTTSRSSQQHSSSSSTAVA